MIHIAKMPDADSCIVRDSYRVAREVANGYLNNESFFVPGEVQVEIIQRTKSSQVAFWDFFDNTINYGRSAFSMVGKYNGEMTNMMVRIEGKVSDTPVSLEVSRVTFSARIIGIVTTPVNITSISVDESGLIWTAQTDLYQDITHDVNAFTAYVNGFVIYNKFVSIVQIGTEITFTSENKIRENIIVQLSHLKDNSKLAAFNSIDVTNDSMQPKSQLQDTGSYIDEFGTRIYLSFDPALSLGTDINPLKIEVFSNGEERDLNDFGGVAYNIDKDTVILSMNSSRPIYEGESVTINIYDDFIVDVAETINVSISDNRSTQNNYELPLSGQVLPDGVTIELVVPNVQDVLFDETQWSIGADANTYYPAHVEQVGNIIYISLNTDSIIPNEAVTVDHDSVEHNIDTFTNYSVTNNSNGSSDTTPPVITLVGDNPQTVNLGGTYSELGATASDDTDGDITANIIIDSSNVDANTEGSYAVTYNVQDAAGNNASQVTRTVNVVQAYGAEQITNGDFATGDLTGFEQKDSAALSVVNNAANVSTNGSYDGIQTTYNITAGKTYRFLCDITNYADTIRVQIVGNGAEGLEYINSNGTHEIEFSPTVSGQLVIQSNGIHPNSFTIDNISLKEKL